MTAATAQLQRIIFMIPILADGEPHRIFDLIWDAGIDRSQLLDDLQSIADRFDESGGLVDGLQIFVDRETVTLVPSPLIGLLRLTKAELIALELGLAMQELEQPLGKRVGSSARFRIESVLDKLPDDGSVPGDLDLLRRLRDALRQRRRVRVRYRKPGDGRATARLMSPYAVVFAGGSWHAVLHSEGADEVRIFRLDWIEEVELVPVKYSAPPKGLVESILEAGKGFDVERERTLRVRYSPRIAGSLAERAGKQPDADGTLTLEETFTDLDWAVRQVLQFGPDVEVLEPEEVRDAVVQRLRRMESI